MPSAQSFTLPLTSIIHEGMAQGHTTLGAQAVEGQVQVSERGVGVERLGEVHRAVQADHVPVQLQHLQRAAGGA